ncbi:MAG: hypothetical protein V4537_04675 [Pseudomonadota bacterium]
MRDLMIGVTGLALLSAPAVAQRTSSGLPAFKGLPTTPDRCNPTAGMVDYREKRARSQKLGDQPPASQFYAVYTVVDGCAQPVVIRKGIGGNPDATAPVLRSPPRARRAG